MDKINVMNINIYNFKIVNNYIFNDLKNINDTKKFYLNSKNKNFNKKKSLFYYTIYIYND